MPIGLILDKMFPHEYDDEVRSNEELLMNPLTIARSENESCLIELSINSVRVSIKIKLL